MEKEPSTSKQKKLRKNSSDDDSSTTLNIDTCVSDDLDSCVSDNDYQINAKKSDDVKSATTSSKHPNLSKSKGFKRDLPFQPHHRLDPRIAAAYIGLSPQSMFDILGPVYSHNIQTMSDGSVTTLEAVFFATTKEATDIKRNILESLVEYSRQSYIKDEFNLFSKRQNICLTTLWNRLEEEDFNVNLKVDGTNYISDHTLGEIFKNSLLPHIMDMDDQEKFRRVHLLPLTYQRNLLKCKNKKRKKSLK